MALRAVIPLIPSRFRTLPVAVRLAASYMSPRRGAGVVERDGLENRCTGNRTVGSNPTLSANSSALDMSGWQRIANALQTL